MNELLTMVPAPVLIIIGLLLIASLIIIIITYLKERTLDQIRADVYKLFLQAEHAFKASELGKQKMKWVVQRARSLLPDWLQVFITEEVLQAIIQKWFDEIKDLLDDGKNNDSQGVTES